MPPRIQATLRWIPLAAVPALALVALAMAPAAPQPHPAPAALPAPAAAAASAYPAPPAPPEAPDPPDAPPPPPGRHAREMSRTWLGVVLSGDDGTEIDSVADNSPAAEAGLKKGDRILEIDGREVKYARDVVRMVRSASPGDEVKVRVDRDGSEKTFTVTLAERAPGEMRRFQYMTPEGGHVHGMGPGRHVIIQDDGEEGEPGTIDKKIVIAPRMHMSRNFLGVEILEMSEDLRAAMKAPRDSGVLVNKVVEDSPASAAGLKAGDIIVSVDGNDVSDAGDIGSALQDHEAGDRVTVKVIRGGDERSFDVKVAPRPAPAMRHGGMWMGPGAAPRASREAIRSYINDEELRRLIDDAMKQAQESMRQYHEQMREQGEQMRKLQQDLRQEMREQNEQIRRQIQEQIQRARPEVRVRNVYDI